MSSRPRNTVRAFTLVEVLTVVLIMGILAVAVRPALDSMNGSRRGAAVSDVKRRLELARARAIATGKPYALKINATTDTVQMYWIPSTGATPVAAPSPSGEAEPVYSIPVLYPTCEITSFTNGDASSQYVWFGVDGTPQARNAAGTVTGSWTQDATIVMSGGTSIFVRRVSGAVQP